MIRNRLAIILGALTIASASQAMVVLNFSSVFTGDTPVGAAPWATLSIEDDGANQVKMIITNNLSFASGQFLAYVNLNLTSMPGGLALGAHDSKVTSISSGNDSINDSGLKFDLRVNFDIAPPTDRIRGGQSATWRLTGTGLDETDFAAYATPTGQNPSNIQAMLHIQGIPDGQAGSGKVTPGAVPEPASMAALGVGLVGLIRRRTKK